MRRCRRRATPPRRSSSTRRSSSRRPRSLNKQGTLAMLTLLLALKCRRVRSGRKRDNLGRGVCSQGGKEKRGCSDVRGRRRRRCFPTPCPVPPAALKKGAAGRGAPFALDVRLVRDLFRSLPSLHVRAPSFVPPAGAGGRSAPNRVLSAGRAAVADHCGSPSFPLFGSRRHAYPVGRASWRSRSATCASRRPT